MSYRPRRRPWRGEESTTIPETKWFGKGGVAANLVSTAVVNKELTSDNNYVEWRSCLEKYLLDHDIWDTVNNESKPEEDRVEFEIWKMKNAMALYTIQLSCGPDILSKIKKFRYAKDAWDFLAKGYGKQSVSPSSLGSKDRVFVKYKDLLEAVQRDNFNAVKDFVDRNPKEELGEVITYGGKTALHVAVTTGHVNIVELLVQNMSPEQLEKQDADGCTALSAAALIGDKNMAECIYNRNKKLTKIPTSAGMIPVVLAASEGHKDMVNYLYAVTHPNELTGANKVHGAMLISKCILGKIFGVALKLLKLDPHLHLVDSTSVQVLEMLSQMPSAFRSGSRLTLLQRVIYSCIPVQLTDQEIGEPKQGKTGQETGQPEQGTTGQEIEEPNQGKTGQETGEPKQGTTGQEIEEPNEGKTGQETGEPKQGITGQEIEEPNQGKTGRLNVFKQVFGQLHALRTNLLKLLGFEYIYEKKLMNVQAVELVRCIGKQIPFPREDPENPGHQSGSLYNAIFQAVRHGIVEFITEIIKANPELLWCRDEHNRDIFMNAVLYRQEKIFSLIYGIKARNVIPDSDGNNMLHLAGMLEPSTKLLDRIPGAALQMQRELQWFKEVESIVNHKCKESPNKEGERPSELFAKNHKNLVKEGQEWMKGTATSCSVVAALIVTIMFAVAFTVPGGNNNDSGFPILLKRTLFKVFIVSDAVSFFSSATSAMIFLGILTSRYAQKDFFESLPKKMLAGQITLFISIATMMIAFSTALILILRGQSLWVYILIILSASVPIVPFVVSQFPLLLEIFNSTLGRGIFNKKTEPWL